MDLVINVNDDLVNNILISSNQNIKWFKAKPKNYHFKYLKNKGLIDYVTRYFTSKSGIDFSNSFTENAIPIYKITPESSIGYEPLSFNNKTYIPFYIILGLSSEQNYKGGEMLFNMNVSVSDKSRNFRIFNAKNTKYHKLDRGQFIIVNNKKALFKISKVKEGTLSFAIIPFKDFIFKN